MEKLVQNPDLSHVTEEILFRLDLKNIKAMTIAYEECHHRLQFTFGSPASECYISHFNRHCQSTPFSYLIVGVDNKSIGEATFN